MNIDIKKYNNMSNKQRKWLRNQEAMSHFTLDTIIYGISKQPFEFTATEDDTETIIAYLAADFEKEQKK